MLLKQDLESLESFTMQVFLDFNISIIVSIFLALVNDLIYRLGNLRDNSKFRFPFELSNMKIEEASADAILYADFKTLFNIKLRL